MITEVELCFKALSAPDEKACVGLSVGINPSANPPSPRLGPMAKGFINEHPEVCDRVYSYRPIPPKQEDETWLFQLVGDNGRRRPVYLIPARDFQGPIGERSLESITRATRTALRHIEDEAEFQEVVMGLLSAGPGRPDNPAYCLISQLAGIRDFLCEPPNGAKPSLKRIEIRIVDLLAWMPIADGRVPAEDLLTSGLSRVLVRVQDNHGHWEEYAVSLPNESTVDDVLNDHRIADEGIEVSAHPLSSRTRGEVKDLPLFPGMIIEVRPQTMDPSGFAPASVA